MRKIRVRSVPTSRNWAASTPAAGVQERGGEAGGAVEEDLEEEDARQQRADLAELLDVDARGGGDRVQPEDQRRGEEGDERDRGEHDERHRDDHVGGLLVVLLDVGREQRDQRRRQHPTDEQLVDDVRGLVADRVGVGQRALPDHVAEHDDAQQPRDPRERRPRRDDEVGPQEAHRCSTTPVEGFTVVSRTGRR